MAADHFGSGAPGGVEPQLADLRQEWLSLIALALLVMGGLGVWWFVSPGPRVVVRPLCVSLVLALTGGIAYALRTRWPRIARTVLFAGPLVGFVMALATLGSPVTPFFAILIAIADCALSPGLGLAAATLSTAVILAPPRGAYVLPALALIWLALAMSWLSSRGLYTVVGWAWHSQQRAGRLLEELRDRQGQLNRTLVALTEATRRLQRTNNALAIARLHAEETSRMQEQFAANISHELRTPLNLIVGFSEMMVTAPQSYGGVSLPSTYRGDAMAIYRSARHLSDLINDVLDLSQIDIGRMAMRKEPADLQAVIREAAEIMRDVAEARGLRLELQVSDNIPLLRLDRTRIRQVLLNLLANAIRFTDQGWIRIRAGVEGQEVLVSVLDSGCGIAPDKLARVFEPFSQASDDGRRGGSGLGLAVSKKFVEMHGGRMWLESKEDQGTMVSFTFPIPEEGKDVQALVLKASPGPRGQEQQPLVLVLHDDPRALALLHRFIEGYEFVSADTAAQAREICEETPPAAVVVDASWAERSTADLEPLGLPPDIPLVTCPLPSLRRLAAALGAVDVLTKPVTREDLAEALSRLSGPLHKVLIVDDDAHMVRLLARMVRAGNPSLHVLEAFDGKEGLQVARAQRPDLVFLDLVMPNMADGYALLREIRQDETLAGTRVIVVSAHAVEEETAPMAGELRLGREAGFSLTDILQALQALLPVITRSAARLPAMAAAPATDRPG